MGLAWINIQSVNPRQPSIKQLLCQIQPTTHKTKQPCLSNLSHLHPTSAWRSPPRAPQASQTSTRPCSLEETRATPRRGLRRGPTPEPAHRSPKGGSPSRHKTGCCCLCTEIDMPQLLLKLHIYTSTDLIVLYSTLDSVNSYLQNTKKILLLKR